MEVVRNARTVFYVLRRRGIERGSYLHVRWLQSYHYLSNRTHLRGTIPLTSFPSLALGSKMTLSKPALSSPFTISRTLGIRSIDFPEYATSVSAKMRQGWI